MFLSWECLQLYLARRKAIDIEDEKEKTRGRKRSDRESSEEYSKVPV